MNLLPDNVGGIMDPEAAAAFIADRSVQQRTFVTESARREAAELVRSGEAAKKIAKDVRRKKRKAARKARRVGR